MQLSSIYLPSKVLTSYQTPSPNKRSVLSESVLAQSAAQGVEHSYEPAQERAEADNKEGRCNFYIHFCGVPSPNEGERQARAAHETNEEYSQCYLPHHTSNNPLPLCRVSSIG